MNIGDILTVHARTESGQVILIDKQGNKHLLANSAYDDTSVSNAEHDELKIFTFKTHSGHWETFAGSCWEDYGLTVSHDAPRDEDYDPLGIPFAYGDDTIEYYSHEELDLSCDQHIECVREYYATN